VTAKELKTMLIGAAIVILLSIGFTTTAIHFKVPVRQALKGYEDEGPLAKYQMGQVVPVCRESLASHVQGKVIQANFDTISSRYDIDRNAYLIFYDVQTRTRHGDTSSFHIVCTVSGASKRIIDYEVITGTVR
jgi:hypothetical protein